MLTLYASKGTGSIAPQALLAYAQADYEIVWIDYDADEHHGEAFLSVNPRGQLPALKLDDGTVVTESAAIMLHLADSFPKAALIAPPGSSTRAEHYRWLVFLATNVYEDFLRLAYPQNYTTDASGQASVSEAGAAAMDRSWGIISGALRDRPFLVAETLSIADIYMAMLLTWHRDLNGLHSRYPNLVAAAQHTIEIPEIRAVFLENESDLQVSRGVKEILARGDTD